MKRHVFIILASFFVLGATLFAAAQLESATVQGTVTDQQGQPVVGAVVTFQGTNTGISFSTKTDKKGEFLRVGVKADVYHVTATKDGQQIGEVATFPVNYSSAPPPLKITAHAAAAPVGSTAAAAAPSASVPLTATQKLALEELQKLAASAPKKDDKAVKEKLEAAKAKLSLGSFDQAIPICTEVTAMDPMNDEAWSWLGYSYLRQGKNDLAIPALEKAVALKPSQGGYHQSLAVAYAKTGKVDESLAEFASAIQTDPANAALYYLYTGILLSDHKQPGPAIAAFDKAIAADPKMADAYYFKGVNLIVQAKQENGKIVAPAGTAEAFKKYLELQPNGPRAASAKAQLGRLGG